MLGIIEGTIGVSAILKLRTGAQPANCAAADSGTVVATMNLASDWMAAASAGAVTFNGLPIVDTSADNAGTIAHYRLYASDGTTCHMQGSVATSGGDMTVDNAVVAAAQQVSVTAWTLNMAGHA